MTTPATPSVDDLVTALAEDSEAVRVAQRRRQAMAALRPDARALPRPHWAMRLAVGAIVLALGASTAMAMVIGREAGGLLAEIRAREHALDHPAPAPLPSSERLLDAGSFAADLAARPADATRLRSARGRALLDAGRWQEAVDLTRAAGGGTADPASSGAALVCAQALERLGRWREARDTLLATDLSPLDAAERAVAVALIGRCHLVLRRE